MPVHPKTIKITMVQVILTFREKRRLLFCLSIDCSENNRLPVPVDLQTVKQAVHNRENPVALHKK